LAGHNCFIQRGLQPVHWCGEVTLTFARIGHEIFPWRLLRVSGILVRWWFFGFRWNQRNNISKS
jgi:hypothetical protein